MEGFKNTFSCIFNKNALLIKKIYSCKWSSIYDKETAQSHYEKTQTKNKFLKSKTFSERNAYTSQRNFCKKLLRNTKRTYFNNLDTKKVTNNRTFWKLLFGCFKHIFEKWENKSDWGKWNYLNHQWIESSF